MRGPEVGSGPDPVAVSLLVRTQGILFSRHAKTLKQYKFAGYPLLLAAMQVCDGGGGCMRPATAPLSVRASCSWRPTWHWKGR